LTNVCKAQDEIFEVMPQVVPVSPNSASLGIYGAIPVGHYTGTTNISIPLYEINLDGKKFPISISYHSSGIKVSQEASSIGLGWALNAGGVISKEVRSWDDFEGNPLGFYFNNDFPIPDDFNNPDLSKYNEHQIETKYRPFVIGQRDSEPDIFYFNFSNHSGSMFFLRNGEGNNTKTKAYPIVRKQENYLHAEYDIPRKAWIIYDGEGFKYYFNSYETTKYFVDGGYGINLHPDKVKNLKARLTNAARHLQHEVVTSWSLDSIVSPLNNKVIFEYRREKIYSTITLHEYVGELLHFTGQWYQLSNYQIYPESYSYSRTEIDQLCISKITTEKETIDFLTETRYDIEPVQFEERPKKITGIQVRNKQEELIKNFNLESTEKGRGQIYKEYKNRKLFLDYVEEKIGEKSHKHTFSYDENDEIPDKNSNKVDDWGYYNGLKASSDKWSKTAYRNENCYTFIPEIILLDYTYHGRKKTIVDSKRQLGILKSITYPTGGSSHFTYESHVTNKLDKNENTQEKRDTIVAQVSTFNFTPDPYDYPEDGDLPQIISDYEFELKEQKDVTFSYWFNIVERYEGYNDTYVNIQLRKANGSLVKEFSFGRENNEYQKDIIIKSLPSGKYILSILAAYSPHRFWLSSTVKYGITIDNNSSTREFAKAGGLRIKEIQNRDRGNTISTIRYNYSLATVMRDPVFWCTSSVIARNVNDYATYKFLTASSSSYVPLSSSAMGNPIGYTWVKETHISENGRTNGATEYTFHNEEDALPLEADYLGSFLYKGLHGSPNMLNGLPEYIETFNTEGDLVESTYFEYDYDDNLTKSIKGFVCNVPEYVNSTTMQIGSNLFKFYSLVSKWHYLEKKTVNQYGIEGAPMTSTVTLYDYDRINYKPVSIKTTSSGGRIFETKISYPTVATDIIGMNMKNSHHVNIPTEKLSLVDNMVVSGFKNLFYDQSKFFQLKEVHKTNLNNPTLINNLSSFYKKEFEITEYDKKGNILTMIGRNNIPINYLWSYSGQYPLAEIKNATYEDVRTVLGWDDSIINSLSNKIEPSPSDISIINSLRQKLPNAMITTYTYQPLVGMLTFTDPRGITTYYEYDAFGRLKRTYIKKNGVEKNIQSYDYHYRNQ